MSPKNVMCSGSPRIPSVVTSAGYDVWPNYHMSQEHLSNDQVRDYFRHLLLSKKLAHSSCKAYLAGINYFLRHICGRQVDDRFGLPPRLRGRKLTAVFSMEEVKVC